MKRFALGTLLITPLVLLMAAPAAAQATRTWVSGVGDDANPCSRTAPCKTFAGAISKTAANGEISVLDPGGYGAVSITKSMSLVAEGVEGSILNASTNGIIVNGPGIVVNLRGILIEGAGTSSATSGFNGIRFIQGAALHITNGQIRNNNNGAAPNANGISFTPSTAAELTIVDTLISDNGGAGVGAGILIKPTAGGAAKVSLERVQVVNNAAGVIIDGSTSTTGIAVSVKDSNISGNNGFGFNTIASNVQAPTALVVRSSTVSNNSQAAFRNQGANASTTVSGSNISGNGGVAFNTVSGSIFSTGDNTVTGNVAGGSTPTALPPQ